MKHIQITIIIFLILGIISCKEKQQKTILNLSIKESVNIDKKFILDSIVILRTEKNIIIRQYRGRGNHLEVNLIKGNKGFSEFRSRFYGLVANDEDERKAQLMPVDTIPVFYKGDTIFTFKCNRNFYHSTMDLSLGDAQYKIEKNGNTNVSSRKSIIDTSFEEAYYYDMDYNIFKYIVKLRGSVYIYR